MIAALMMLTGVIVCAEPARPASPGTRDVKSELTPEARPFNERGVALVHAGAYAEGVVELERACALLPDPLLHRAGRSKVLGSLRSALVSLHAATGDPAHLGPGRVQPRGQAAGGHVGDVARRAKMDQPPPATMQLAGPSVLLRELIGRASGQLGS